MYFVVSVGQCICHWCGTWFAYLTLNGIMPILSTVEAAHGTRRKSSAVVSFLITFNHSHLHKRSGSHQNWRPHLHLTGLASGYWTFTTWWQSGAGHHFNNRLHLKEQRQDRTSTHCIWFQMKHTWSSHQHSWISNNKVLRRLKSYLYKTICN